MKSTKSAKRPAPRTSDEAVRQATGRNRAKWFALLDTWGAATQSHRDIAAWLTKTHGVDSWWSQTLTVDYEQARGLRQPGGSRDGTFSVGVSLTVPVPVSQLYMAVIDPRQRKRWLSDGTMRVRTAQPNRTARFDWEDGATRVHAYFTAVNDGKSSLSMQHERLPNARAANAAKASWRKRLTTLKASLQA